MEIMFDVPNHHGGDMATATTKKEDLRFAPSQGIHCPACDKTKAHYEFNLNKTRPNGRQVYCRRCQRASQKISREKVTGKPKTLAEFVDTPATIKHVAIMGATEKTIRCYRCKTNKPVSAFGKDKASKRGYQSYCKECRSVKAKPTFWGKIKKAIRGLFA